MRDRLLSVIIPVYNCKNDVSKAIDSVLGNSYHHLEVLVGDDASTDGTAEELQKYAADSRVRIFHSPRNMGAAAIRNWMLQEATGDYIAFQDADDWSSPRRFERQIQVLESENVDVVGTGTELIDLNGQVWGHLLPPAKPSEWAWLRQNAMVHASIVLRKSVVGSARYRESLTVGEDYFFLTQLYLQGAQFRNISEPLYHYRIERSRLQKRTLRKNWKVLQAKVSISRLFPWPQNILFLMVNIPIFILSVARGFFL